jgi:uncharacterized membrane protein YczE
MEFVMENNKKIFIKRIIMCVFGVVICGISVGFFKRAMFGVDPFQVFMAGLDELIPIQFGVLYVIANVCLLLFSLITDRHFIGLGTFINLFFLGYIVDFSRNILFALFPEIGITLRFVFLVIGIVVMCLASSLYFTADLGVSTYDAVALIISGTWKKGQFKWVRVICDFVCVAIGIILYIVASGTPSGVLSIVGVGTIITAFFMGPLIDFFNRKVSQVILNGRQG